MNREPVSTVISVIMSSNVIDGPVAVCRKKAELAVVSF
jgi:hypothetical protein